MKTDRDTLLVRIRVLIGIVIGGLVVGGLTAFPLAHEIDLLHAWTRLRSVPAPVAVWIAKVQQGLHVVDSTYPFLSYGTDWLAFGHLVIAFLFIGPFLDPVRNAWVIRAGEVACVLIVPNALVCGEIRDIPPWWRGIDCAFGVLGFVPLWLADRFVRRIEQEHSHSERNRAE